MITEETLWSYVDGTLDEHGRRAVALAIADDARVADMYKEILALHTLLQAQQAEQPPAGFVAGVIGAIQPAGAYRLAPKISVMPVLVFALPLLVITLAGCIILGNKGFIPPLAVNLSPVFWSNIKLCSLFADVALLLPVLGYLVLPVQKGGGVNAWHIVRDLNA